MPLYVLEIVVVPLAGLAGHPQRPDLTLNLFGQDGRYQRRHQQKFFIPYLYPWRRGAIDPGGH